MSKVNTETLMKRNCMARLFAPLTPGSMRGSIFALVQTAIGAGLLSLPYAFAQNGIITSTVLIVTGAVLGYKTMVWLMHAGNNTGENNYALIVEKILGPKWGVIMHIVFTMTTFFVTTLYFITAATFMPDILKDFTMDDDTANSNSTR